MLSLTPTKLKSYITCRHMYELKHVKRAVGFVRSPAAAFGSSLHRALEELHKPVRDVADRPTAARIDPRTDVEQLLARHWEDAYASRQDSESYFASACDALKRYLDHHANGVGWTLGTEAFLARVFNAEGLRVRLGCKADRIGVAADGVLEITDYKTCSSGKVPTAEYLRSHLPTFVYYVLARACYPEYPAARLVFLNVLSLARVEVRYDQATIATNKNELRATFRRIAAQDFTPRACEACAWCDCASRCSLYSGEVSLEAIS